MKWPELVVLMAYGDGTEDRVAGTLITREVEPVPDDVAAQDLASEDVLVASALGPLRVAESAARLWRRGPLVRREQLDGRPVAILGVDERWIWLDGVDVPTLFHRAMSSWSLGELAERWPASRWEGDDFTRLTGPITATEFLGRPAWSFELAPPRHKPFPMQLIVDAATGLILRQGNAGLGSYAQWTSLQVGLDLPDELFTWTGPVRAQPDRRLEHEAELARRRSWLDTRGLAEITLAVPIAPMLHWWDDASGAFHLSLRAAVDGSLLRRPASVEAWDEADEPGWPHRYRWCDQRWDWVLGSNTPMSEGQLATLQAQLSAN